ncbi:MAG: peptidylprolyl isomerase [Pelagibacteraceae bacterium]|nr:peptidylprolyl isomerase [Pelagibacteraceae bacterium]
MNYIKKIIYFIITLSFTLIVFSTLILFFYAAFFFEPPAVERKTEENQITKSEESSTLPIEEVEPKKEIVKVDVSEVEEVIVDVPEVEEVIKDSLFATVGNKAITQSDIINEIKIILILTGQSFTQDIKEQLQSRAIQLIIKRNIKKIEIEKYNSLTFNQPDVDKGLKKLAGNLFMDLDTFENTFIANGIPFSNVIDQIQTELLWNSLIFELYKDRLVISLDEIGEQLKLMQNKKEIEEYLISEIIIKQVPKDKLESTIKEIKNKIKIEGFEKVAMNLSISETALQGGDLDWISENAISEKFKSRIINTPVGNISEPIFLPEGILFFKVRDKRKLKKIVNLEDAKNQLVKVEKTKILRMHSLSHYKNLRKSITINYY